MAKEKEARRPFNLKREVKLLPGYIILLLWVIFTIALLGWVFGASFSTTAEIFQGKALKFESGLHFENYAKSGVDLVLSGHVHGGIVRVPFWGKGVLSPNVRLFPRYDGGIFHKGESTMLVDRGLGEHTIPFRLFNPAELWVLCFEPL